MPSSCLVPGRPTNGPGSPRRHLADVTLRDFSVAGALLTTSVGQVRLAVRMQIVNVGFGAAEPANDPDPNTVSYNIALAECGSLTMSDCYLDGGLRLTVGQDVFINNFVARSITSEEYSIDYNFVNTTTNGGGGWTSNDPPCERMNMTNCVIRNYGSSEQGIKPNVQFAKWSRITGLTIADSRFPPATGLVIFVKADHLQFTNVISDTPLCFQADYQQLTNVTCARQMIFDAEHLRVLNVDVTVPPSPPIVQPIFEFKSGSSGLLLTPLPPNANVVFNASQDDWRFVARTRLDGKFQSLSQSTVPSLSVLAAAGMIPLPIAEFCTSAGMPLLVVRGGRLLGAGDGLDRGWCPARHDQRPP